MARDIYGVDSIVHVTQRGTRGLDIVRDDDDRKRFVRALFYLNDEHSDPHWRRITDQLEDFTWPSEWPERDPLVRIIGWTLLSNHFHIVVQETKERGLARFMQRFGGSMAMSFNKKYDEMGNLFQSSYHARVIYGDTHLRYLAFYVLVKNVLDMYPDGLDGAYHNFNDAWEWAKRYEYSSFKDVQASVESPVLGDQDQLFASIIGRGDAFKNEARELLAIHRESRGGDYKSLMLESW